LMMKLNRLKGDLHKIRSNSHSAFFFFPFYHVGGAERVHVDILECVNELNPVVFFTKTSENNGFLARFEKNAVCFDVGELCWYPWFKQRTYKLIADFINEKDMAFVFGSNSIAMYEMIPQLKADVVISDLIHAFVHPEEIGPEKWSLPYLDRIQNRVLISKKALDEMSDLYAKRNISPELNKRFVFIRNYTRVPDKSLLMKALDRPLRIVYVGRGSAEKRINIIGAIANSIHRIGVLADFVFIGKDLESAMDPQWREDCIFTGEITNDDMLSSEWIKADLLLMTSSREGFPMVIMEAMAHSVVPISTAVGDIPNVITHGNNGFLLPEKSDDGIIQDAVKIIIELNSDRDKLKAMANQVHLFANSEFSHEKFRSSYRKLFRL
jgi:L-malate glycosyltransferase